MLTEIKDLKAALRDTINIIGVSLELIIGFWYMYTQVKTFLKLIYLANSIYINNKIHIK